MQDWRMANCWIVNFGAINTWPAAGNTSFTAKEYNAENKIICPRYWAFKFNMNPGYKIFAHKYQSGIEISGLEELSAFNGYFEK
jgi:hypothetical protein